MDVRFGRSGAGMAEEAGDPAGGEGRGQVLGQGLFVLGAVGAGGEGVRQMMEALALDAGGVGRRQPRGRNEL